MRQWLSIIPYRKTQSPLYLLAQQAKGKPDVKLSFSAFFSGLSTVEYGPKKVLLDPGTFWITRGNTRTCQTLSSQSQRDASNPSKSNREA